MDSVDLGKEDIEAQLARRIAEAPAGEAVDAEGYCLLAPRARRYGLRRLRDEHAAADLMQHVMALTIEQLRRGALREPERIVSAPCSRGAAETVRARKALRTDRPSG